MITAGMFEFREPLWLLLVLYPFGQLLINGFLSTLRSDAYADRHLQAWAVSHLQDRKGAYRLRLAGYFLVWCCLAIAMAGPRIAQQVYPVKSQQGTDLMIVLDTSASMSANDVLPDRGVRAHHELLDLLRYDNPLRIGLTVFAARPHLVSPLTHDKAVIRHYLAAVKTSMLPTAGSEVRSAIEFAIDHFDTSGDRQRLLLLLTDGDNTDITDSLRRREIASRLQQADVSLYILGVGTPTGQFAQYQQSNVQGAPSKLTRLQREALRDLARLANGSYADIADDNDEWRQLYANGMQQVHLARADDSTVKAMTTWKELYQMPLAIGSLLFILVSLVPDRRRAEYRHLSGSAIVIVSLVVLGAGWTSHANAGGYADALALYDRGEYEQAQASFSRLPGFTARFGEANALYMMGDHEAARMRYLALALSASTDGERAQVLFNLGNAYYMLEEFAQAGQIYRDVLRYQPQHEAAQINLAHAELQQEAAARFRGVGEAGTGSIAKRAMSGLDLDAASVTLDDAEEIREPELPEPEQLTTEEQIEGQVTLVRARATEREAGIEAEYRFNSVESLYVYRQALQSDEHAVWKRLFEEEEGFPAPVASPHPVPGVVPW